MNPTGKLLKKSFLSRLITPDEAERACANAEGKFFGDSRVREGEAGALSEDEDLTRRHEGTRTLQREKALFATCGNTRQG